MQEDSRSHEIVETNCWAMSRTVSWLRSSKYNRSDSSKSVETVSGLQLIITASWPSARSVLMQETQHQSNSTLLPIRYGPQPRTIMHQFLGTPVSTFSILRLPWPAPANVCGSGMASGPCFPPLELGWLTVCLEPRRASREVRVVSCSSPWYVRSR